ncbi:MAG TPA: hypothetical protein VJL29_06755, partial [Thermoguttaceae bacterium]|nr:hypothetical protein [Thermoguttaceae bacterium]
MRNLRADRHFRPMFVARAAVCLLLAGLTFGCAAPLMRHAEPLLRQPRMSPDSVVLDVFLLKCPFGDPELNGPAWSQIDEQPFPADLRRHLLANGFRAGVLTGRLPDELATRLEVADDQPLPGETTPLKLDQLAEEPAVLRGHFQLRAGARKELT